jgi:hypothetical protein
MGGRFPNADLAAISRLLLISIGEGFRFLAQPTLDLIHSPAVAVEGEYHLDCLSRSRHHIITVPKQELVRDGNSSALVTADPRVIFNETEAEGGGLPDEVCVLIRGGLLRAGGG